MEAQPDDVDVDFEEVASGDTVSWTESWGGGDKQIEATVIDVETEHFPAELTRPARDVHHLRLDVDTGADTLEAYGAAVEDGHHKITLTDEN